MSRIILDYSFWLLPLCLVAGLVYACLLYSRKPLWSKEINYGLFTLRTLTVSALTFLLLGPVIKFSRYTKEAPGIVLLVDNSQSTGKAKEVKDKKWLDNFSQTKEALEKSGYEVHIRDLENNAVRNLDWKGKTSDIAGALKEVTAEMGDQNLSHILLISDGIYNTGISPLYFNSAIPISTMGLGDTIAHPDLILKSLTYNQVAYQGNRFPLRAEISAQKLSHQNITVTVHGKGKELGREVVNTGAGEWVAVNFLIDASEEGLQQYDVSIEPLKNEYSRNNNSSTAFVDVVKGKKKILLAAAAPTPDIKALRYVIEKNPNYELILHIPGISQAPPKMLVPGEAELVIIPDAYSYDRNNPVLAAFIKSKTPVFLILSETLNQQATGIPIRFDRSGGTDQITPQLNTTFLNFNFLQNAAEVFSKFPPVTVPFGKFTYPANAHILFHQRIGSVSTDRPWLLSWDNNGQKMAVAISGGFWKWRLREYAQHEQTEIFDNVFGKLIQYLCGKEDKRRFRCFPVRSEFLEGEAVEMEVQTYNEIFELVYGNTVQLQLRQDKTTKNFEFVTSQNPVYKLGLLPAGVYTYTAQTNLGGKTEVVRGQFVVRPQNVENQTSTANHTLLRRLSGQTQGHFYAAGEWEKFVAECSPAPKAKLHEDSSYHPLIDWQWLFFWLILFLSAEWFIRKWSGGY